MNMLEVLGVWRFENPTQARILRRKRTRAMALRRMYRVWYARRVACAVCLSRPCRCTIAVSCHYCGAYPCAAQCQGPQPPGPKCGVPMPTTKRPGRTVEANPERGPNLRERSLSHDRRRRVAARGELEALRIGRAVPLACDAAGLYSRMVYPMMTAKGLRQFAKAARALRISFTQAEGRAHCPLLPPPTDGVSAWECFGTASALDALASHWTVIEAHDRISIVTQAKDRADRMTGQWSRENA